MKSTHQIYLSSIIGAFVLSFLISCESPVGFTKPQPEGQPDLVSFPESFRGMYLCQTDSVIVKVTHNMIYTETTEEAVIPVQYITDREDCSIVNDSLRKQGYEHCVKIEYKENGYISAVKVSTDTLFRITPFQKVRMHKGNLVLSQVTENDQWTIALLQPDGNKGIRYRAIVEDSDLEKIAEITPMTKNTNTKRAYPDYKISPRTVELDQLFEDPDIFVDCNYYTRIHLIE